MMINLCPQCGYVLEYDDDPDCESWSGCNGFWRCDNCLYVEGEDDNSDYEDYGLE